MLWLVCFCIEINNIIPPPCRICGVYRLLLAMLRNKLVKGAMMSQDSKQYSCIIRFLDDSEPLTVTYQVSNVVC